MRYSWLIILSVSLVGCRYPKQPEDYEVGYNFMVVADSVPLQVDMPMHLLIAPERGDSVYVGHGDQVVVAQIVVIPEDSLDSVWVKIARDQLTQGWLHERELLQSVIPDEPISHGIYLFSGSHVVVTVALSLLVSVVWLGRRMRRKRYHIVHIDDIPSPYPLMLCLILSSAAILYASIQKFVPETWAYFYFHPTLNPFGLPACLALFLTLVWLTIIFFCASVMEIFRNLRAVEAVLYTFSLVAIVAILYMIFSLTTLYYIGYPLFVAYAVGAVLQYVRRHRPKYVCGNCGARMHSLGKCPKCGTLNT
ncbi:MAG: zinc ribbon domain-containing protein [Prevotellaceae bacterium]|nr:zinc ribbon domain-containing protein [Prevotellaceae bacterium]